MEIEEMKGMTQMRNGLSPTPTNTHHLHHLLSSPYLLTRLTRHAMGLLADANIEAAIVHWLQPDRITGCSG
jgi:hypothetical protein